MIQKVIKDKQMLHTKPPREHALEVLHVVHTSKTFVELEDAYQIIRNPSLYTSKYLYFLFYKDIDTCIKQRFFTAPVEFCAIIFRKTISSR